MLLDERKKFIKENIICFLCCSSTAHQAKSCTEAIKCTECESDRHAPAMHPGAPSGVQVFSPFRRAWQGV